ncbi:MAG: hypothetical protein JWR85_2957 [Marmoricola sp.]|nr:hypothetical protein [Marmoricola sp.]
MNVTATAIRTHAIDPTRLDAIRTRGTDGHGSDLVAYPALGEEPLRCCLSRAEPGEEIALISFAPFLHASPWTEVGPVYIHADRCAGHDPSAGLPRELIAGQRILRTYRADDTMNYEHNTLLADGQDMEEVLARLLALPDVATVHVRTVLPQCFLFAVTGLPVTGQVGDERDGPLTGHRLDPGES